PIIEEPATRPRATRGENLLTVLFASWLIAGVFIDGWAHNNDKPETFFTPWHGVFYSGFLATAAWMGWMVQRRRAAGAPGRSAVPIGYGIGLVGVAMFALGGVFDMTWHEIFGIEVDLEAILSPSHLILFLGGILVITSPLRAAWADTSVTTPTFREFLPTLLSMTLATATVGFFMMVFAPTMSSAVERGPHDFIAHEFAARPGIAQWMVEEVQLEGYAAILLTTLILIAPVLYLARRWTLPFGTITFLFGVVSTLVASIESFDQGLTFAAAVVAGLAGDLLYRRLPLRAVATAVPVVMWLAYFAILAVTSDVGWSVELWSGVAVMSGLAGLALSVMTGPDQSVRRYASNSA
ncbi:MAG: hypothetical protein ACRD12_16055, partial [Acidimicrobiales bacterium]